METNKIKPSDLEAEVQRPIDTGQMPSLDDLLAAITETRKEYAPLIVAARKNSDADDACPQRMGGLTCF